MIRVGLGVREEDRGSKGRKRWEKGSLSLFRSGYMRERIDRVF